MDISVKDLEAKIEACFDKKAEYDERKAEANELHAEYKRMQNEVINILESLEMDNYKSKHGTFSFKYTESFKVPKDTDSREKFFGYLKEKGVYDQMISVNSRTLNSFAKQEAEIAEADGDLDFQIPGLVKSDPVAIASMRKK